MTSLRRKPPLVTLLLPACWLLLPGRVWAAEPMWQTQEPNAFGAWVDAQINDLITEGLKAIATLCWFVEKGFAGITRFLTQQDMWTLILDGIFGSLRNVMPTVMQGLLFSNNGAGGLLYLALMLAGILLIVPTLSSTKLVDASRVILWGTIVVTLFVSATWGYDLIGYIEQMRAGAVQVVVQSAGSNGQMDELVAKPMLAEQPDLEDYSFVLPTQFEQLYFPEPGEEDYQELTVFEFGGLITWSWTIRVESRESQQYRRDQAETGVAIAGLTLVPGWVLLLFGVVLATLTAAAMVLIVFFVVAIPLGFFEFGASILSGLIKQYAYLFAVTLLAVILAAILARTSQTTWPSGGPPSLQDMMAFLPVLVIVAVAMSYVAKMATDTMTATFGIVSTSIQTSMAPLVYAGGVPAAGGIPGAELASGAVGMLGAGAAAFATGGLSAALLAAGGAAVAQVDGGAGRQAARVATALGSEHNNHVFAAAARGHGAFGVAAAGIRHGRTAERASRTAFGRAQSAESRLPAGTWGAIDAGAYHTTDPRHLDAAEAAFHSGKKVEARHHLERAFGNRQAAHTALALYGEKDGMARVRGVVEATQVVAAGMTRTGEAIFDLEGKATPAFHQAVWHEVQGRNLVHLHDRETAMPIGQLAGATVRQPIGIWQDADAPRMLARETLHPQQASEVQPGDIAAQYGLHDLARQHDWGEAQLEGLFIATKYGLGAAAGSGQSPVMEVLHQLNQQGEWADTPPPLCRQAAEMALMVAEDAQAQRGVILEVPVAERATTDARRKGSNSNSDADETPVALFPNGTSEAHRTVSAPSLSQEPEENS